MNKKVNNEYRYTKRQVNQTEDDTMLDNNLVHDKEFTFADEYYKDLQDDYHSDMLKDIYQDEESTTY
jgi:hypothetical protein